MDKHIPLDQRQRSVTLAQELRAQTEATRARQLAAADLGPTLPNVPPTPVVTAQPRTPLPVAVNAAIGNPREAGADYARPQVAPARPVVATTPPKPVVAAAAPRPATSIAAAAVAPTPPPVAAAASAWRVQLGAFGVAANADALWARARARPELAGKARLMVPAGKVTKLQVGGFASQEAAQSACSRLAAAGFACIAARN
jgi:cell division septation protein DedD